MGQWIKAGEEMHSYLRAIGFAGARTRTDLEKLVGQIMESPTERYKMAKKDRVSQVEISKDFAERMGITIRGEYDEKGFFHLESYFPYYRPDQVNVKEEIFINKRVDTDAYTGMCDDVRLGVSLIFYLQNSLQYQEQQDKYDGMGRVVAASLCALSSEGSILLGTAPEIRDPAGSAKELKRRTKLIMEARKGNQDAIDSLTIEDIDLFAMISRRAAKEDLYSLVETTFIPYGSESDNYSILGNILGMRLVKNLYTNEEVYQLELECNQILFDVCINKRDLVGIPEVGRRFKGTIWMQGRIDFSSYL